MFSVKSAEIYPKIPHCDQNIFLASFRQYRETLDKYRQSFDKITELIPGKTELRSKVSTNIDKYRQSLENLGDINPEKSFPFPGKIVINPVNL